MHLAIIIPVYNEGTIIKKVIDRLPRTIKGVDKITVLAINDGSTDSSCKEIEKTRAKLISHPINMGYGATSTTGLMAARTIEADIAVTFDGDGQHDPCDIEKVINPIISGEADVVIGTRFKDTRGMPLIKKIGIQGLNIITYILSGSWSSDSQSGFKAVSRQALDLVRFNAIGYEFCSQTIIETSRSGLKIKEVPIKVIYNKYSKRKGQSIFNGVNIVIKLIFLKITG